MRNSVRTLNIALLVFLTSFLSSPLYAMNAALEVVRDDCVRYVSMGRSDSLISLSLYGTKGLATVSQNSDGTFNCRVSGLGIPDDKASASVRLEQAGKLIHESTHCLVVPYMHTIPDDPSDLLVCVEMISPCLWKKVTPMRERLSRSIAKTASLQRTFN